MIDAAYYNDNDPFAAQWLRNLADAGEITAGTVDERSIRDVRGDDVRDYRRVHFFAGIAGWELALALAGWPRDRPVWTGSCPCQPYSSAGKGEGDADPRNLWPRFFELIKECRPECVFGEQVESAIGHGWLDGVCADLEGEGYAVGAVVLGAHSAGAPHIRQRLFWVADSIGKPGHRGGVAGIQEGQREWRNQSPRSREVGWMGDPGREGLAGRSGQSGDDESQQSSAQRAGRDAGGLGHPEGDGRRQERPVSGGGLEGGGAEGGLQRPRDDGPVGGMGLADRPREAEVAGVPEGPGVEREGGVNFWGAHELIYCRDQKYRRTQPGLSPLAHGVPGRVGLLRGYGNAIVVPVAAEFIRAYLDATSGGGC